MGKLNKLTLHLSKSDALIISPTNRKATPNLTLFPDFTNLNIAKSVRYFGVVIDNKLVFDNHINYSNNKVSRRVGVMTKLKHLLPIQILRNIYFALIHSYLNYKLWFRVLLLILTYLF